MALNRLLLLLLRERRTIVYWPIVATVAVIFVLMLRARTYTSVARFTPSASDNYGSPLAGLAAQFGVAVPGGSGEESPAFYVALLRSRGLLEGVVQDSFIASPPRRWWQVREPGPEVTLPLLAWLESDSSRAWPRRLEEGVEQLGQVATPRADQATGIVTLRVSLEDPSLAQQVATKMMERVQRFNQEQRAMRAGEERRFVAERLTEARGELRGAEGALQSFLARNRSFTGSPELKLEYDRLEREVAQRQGVVTTLMQSFETARIDEVRNTPVITVVDPAGYPGRPDRRGLASKALFLFVTLLVAAVGVIRLRIESHPEEVAGEELRRVIAEEWWKIPVIGRIAGRWWERVTGPGA